MQMNEKKERVAYWNERIVPKIGQRYAKHLKEWEFYGSDGNQALQQNVISSLKEYCLKMADHLATGRNLILFGTMGTGKDFMVTNAMRYAVLELGLRLTWFNGAELLDEFLSAQKGDFKKRLIHSLSSAPVLAISDPLQPGAGLTDSQTATLLDVIDKRYRAKRPTWLTVNITDREDAEERTCPQLVDRLWENAELLECKWPSYRERVSRKK
jgi:DNA replication protein DnaC